MKTIDVPAAWKAESRRVLVTGCAGFLGSSLVDALLAHGHDVIGIDCFSDFYDPALKRENLAAAMSAGGFRLIDVDLNDLQLVDLLEDRQYVFHFAAQAGVRDSWGETFDTYLHANVRATQRLLEALLVLWRRGGSLVRLVNSSSSSVYGNQEHYPVVESVDKHPFSPYGVTKFAAELLCGLYASNWGLPTSSLRYFTVYGPRQRPDMAFRRFLEAARRGEPWTVFGDGEQTRDFTFVDDAIRANLLAADDSSPYGVYNIGGGARVSLREALDTLRDAVLRHGIADRVQIVHAERAKGDVRHTGSDGSLAARTIGFRPQVPLTEGLERQALWFSRR
jgi:UDP-glucose 4-epimerase